MPLSAKSREIVLQEYGQLASKLGRKCRQDIDRLRQTSQLGGGLIKAVDDRHVAHIEELFDALCDFYISAFAREGSRMTLQDVEDITAEMTRAIQQLIQTRAELEPRSIGLGFRESLQEVIPRMRHKLVLAMRRFELERDLAPRVAEQRREVMGEKVVYNISGNNARLNVNSTDSSVNVVNIESAQLFAEIRAMIDRELASSARRDELLRHVDRLEATAGTPEYLSRYQQFVSVLADHLSLFQAFLPALSQLIS